jgi:hypothetical protein
MICTICRLLVSHSPSTKAVPEIHERRFRKRARRAIMVDSSILLAASRGNPATVLKEAAGAYKVDTEAIATKVRHEFAAKEKAKRPSNPQRRGQGKRPSHPSTEGGHVPPSSFFLSSFLKLRRENPCWFLPAPSARLLPAFARRPRVRSRVPPTEPSPLLSACLLHRIPRGAGERSVAMER